MYNFTYNLRLKGCTLAVIDVRIDDIDHDMTVKELIRMYGGFRVYIPSHIAKDADCKSMDETLKRLGVPQIERDRRIGAKFGLSHVSVKQKRRKWQVKY